MVYDIAIIGAGPCGLAVAARLREKTPSALYTNDEHARYWKRHSRQANSLEQEQRRRKKSADSGYASDQDEQPSGHPSMIVLDAKSDQWMGAWNEHFQSLNITQLRSPLFFHPDPRDRDGLLAFAHEHDRKDEFCEIPNVVGKELSKHEQKRARSRKQARTNARHLRIDGRDQVDYYTPSTALFHDYCQAIVKRYRLHGLVQEATVLDISYTQAKKAIEGLFSIHCSGDAVINARIVVIATGASTTPSVPGMAQLAPQARTGSLLHVFSHLGASLPRHILLKLQADPATEINILVVGGGLTSAQLCHKFLSKHPSIRVHLLLRHSKMKCKPFDVDLPWVSKTRNHLMSAFWSAETDTERAEMLRQARNGGSVNAPFKRLLDAHVAQGRLTIHATAVLELDRECRWHSSAGKWTYLNVTPPPTVSSTRYFPFPNGIDHIVYATGSKPHFTKIDYLQTLRQEYEVESIGGLPVLNDDLMLHDDVPCFMTGALAALRLGPGAANLAGARTGAEWIAWKVEEIVGKQKSKAGLASGAIEDRDDFTGGFSNQFAALALSR